MTKDLPRKYFNMTIVNVGWLVGIGFNGPLRQYFSLYRTVSQREGERGKKERIDESKNVQTTPTRTYCKRSVGPCPTVIQIVGRPGTGSLPSTIAPPDHLYSQCIINSWCSEIKSVFEYTGLPPEYYQSMTRCDINRCEQALSRKYNYEWSMKCAEMPKLHTYITFKTDFETENYVKSCLSKQERSFLVQLRYGVLPLRVETSRYSGLRPQQRTCQICDSGEVENECHFILDCDLYTTEKQLLYNKIDDQSSQTLNSPEKN